MKTDKLPNLKNVIKLNRKQKNQMLVNTKIVENFPIPAISHKSINNFCRHLIETHYPEYSKVWTSSTAAKYPKQI